MVDVKRALGFPDATRQVTAGAPAAMPSYAPLGPLNRYDPNTSTYNATDATLRRFRLALGRTAAGSASTTIVSTGDSSGGGYNGATYDSTKAMPRQMALVIAMALGISFYDGISPANAGSGVNERWTVSGGSSGGNSSVTTTAANFLTLDAAGFVEHTSSPGTSADFYYSDLSTTNGMTWSIDGVSQGTVATGGTAAWKKLTVTGLAYGTHKIRATWASGTVYVGGAWGYTPGAIGLYFHNLCLGGATANVGASFYNWSDTTAQGVKASHVGMFNLATNTATPDLHTIQIGGNDFNTSPGPAAPNNDAIMTGIATMKAFWPCDVVTIGAYAPTATNPAGWDDLGQRRYTFADSGKHVHFDWNSLVGARAGIVANNAMGADSVHANHEVNILAGRVLGGALDFGNVPLPVSAKMPSGVGNVASGNVILPWNVLTAGAGAPASGSLGLYPIDVGPSPQTIKALAFNVTTAAAGLSGTAVARVVLYADAGRGDGPAVTPASLLANVDVVANIASAGIKLIPVSLTLPPGRYWAGLLYYQGSAAPTTAPAFICPTNGTTIFTSATAFGTARHLYRTGLTAAPTDATVFPPNTTNTQPMVGLQAA